MRAEQWGLPVNCFYRSADASHHVDASPLGIGSGGPVPPAEADRSLQFPQQRLHLDVRAFGSHQIMGGFGGIDLGLQLM